MATPRETLKYYFRKYALPTEQQFAELIDAFVHKDEDMLTQEKIDGLTAALESKVSTETLEQYKAEVQAMIDNATTSGTNISDRLDTAEDNIAGHETRIQALESAQGGSADITVDAGLSTESENPVQNKVIASVLQSKANNTDLQNLQSLVESFLNDADASEATINKWKELESFLSGITDQETLSGLLAALKEEIIALIPEPQQGNFVKQISDLDTYEGTTGEIVQYIGTTTQSFTRGFFYERKEPVTGSSTVTVTESSNPEYYPVGDYTTQDPDGFETTWTAVFVDGTRRSITGTLYHYHGPTGMEYWTHMAPDAINQNGFVILAMNFNTLNYSNTFPATATSTDPTPASWQVIPTGPCVG